MQMEPVGSCCTCRCAGQYTISHCSCAAEHSLLIPLPPLQLEAADAFNQDAHHTAMHLGKAVGMVRLLQGVPYHASLGRCYLPAHVCAARGVSVGAIRKGQPSEALKDVVLDVASVAKVCCTGTHACSESHRSRVGAPGRGTRGVCADTAACSPADVVISGGGGVFDRAGGARF